METRTRLIQLVIDPDDFFRESAANAETNKLYPFLFVLLVGIINSINSVVLLRDVSFEEAAPQISETVFGLVASVGIVTGLFGVFVVWLLYTIAFYVLSVPLGGEGSFRRLFWVVGWGYLPAIISAIVAVCSTVYILGSIPTSAPAEVMLERYESHSVYTAAGLVGLVTLLWQGFIWSFAIQHVRNLSWTKAAAVTSVPLSINILFTVTTLL